jgi:tRNA-binding protein
VDEAGAGPPISLDDFLKVDVRAGTVVSAGWNAGARKPAYVLHIDFGPELGVRASSARISQCHPLDGLVGTQVLAVVNFPPMRIAGVKSEVLTLGVVEADGRVVLVRPALPVANGARLS